MLRPLRFACQFLCFSLIFSFLSACSDDEPELSDTRTLISLDPRALPWEMHDQWVYATDADGILLDIKKVIPRERLILSTQRRVDSFNLTIIGGGVSLGDSTHANLITYANLETGSSFDVHYSSGGLAMIDPTDLALRITSYNGPERGISVINRGYHLYYDENVLDDTFNATIQMCGLPSDVYITSYRDGIPVYAKVNDVKGGDFLDLDMNNNFVPFEHQRKLDFKGYLNSGWVTGAYFGDGTKIPIFHFELIDSDRLRGTKDYTGQPVIGYPNGFDVYEIYAYNAQPSGYVSYHKQGSNIDESFENFKIPTFTYKTLNKELTDFSFQCSEDFTYYTARFNCESENSNFDWTIVAPKGEKVKIAKVPSEILGVIPMLRPESFKFYDCRLTRVIEGDSYKESLWRIYGTDRSKDFEYYEFTSKF